MDQFGVLHNGATALDGAVNCVQELYKAGKSLIILSNASAPSEAALKKLPRYGFDERHFMGAITSGEEAAKYIRKTYGSASTPSKVLFLTWDASDPNNPRLTASPQRYSEECGNIQVATSIGHADFVLAHGSEVWYRGDANQSSLRTFVEEGHFQDVDPILQECAVRRLPLVCANPDFVIVRTPKGASAHMPGKIAARYQEIMG